MKHYKIKKVCPWSRNGTKVERVEPGIYAEADLLPEFIAIFIKDDSYMIEYENKILAYDTKDQLVNMDEVQDVGNESRFVETTGRLYKEKGLWYAEINGEKSKGYKMKAHAQNWVNNKLK